MRLIDADALKHELCIRQHMLNADSLWKALEIMDAQPTADVVERKKGKWIEKWNGHFKTNVPRCSLCSNASPFKYNYCPTCGADMREEKTEMKATEKQIAYAKYLAQRMCVELPTDNTKEAYSAFIDKWKPLVAQEDEAMNEPNEWQWQYS